MTLARDRLRTPGFLCALLALAGPALAQEGKDSGQDEKQEEQEEIQPKIEIPDLTGGNSDQDEMIRLFHEVERTLESIDVELYDASAGRIPIPEGTESGIERLLRSHGAKSDQAVSGIEKILELAQKMGGSGGT